MVVMSVVYQHIRKDTSEVFYIGIGGNIKRAYSHNNRNCHWKNIVAKTEFVIEVLYKDLAWPLACNMEKYLIKEYGRKDLGLGNLVNLTDGGDSKLGAILSEDTKEKMRNAAKKRPPKIWTEDSKLKLSKSIKGRPPSNKGKPISKETALKISVAMTGRKLSEATKLKMRKPKTKEHIENIKKGIKNVRN